jgi:hypothetical protein
MKVWQLLKRYLNIGFLGYITPDHPQAHRIMMIIVVIITIALADTPTVNDRKIGWLTIDTGVQPEVLLPVQVRRLDG